MYEDFPTPLINRLEKHFVLTSSILESWQEAVLSDFEDWIEKFSSTGYVHTRVKMVYNYDHTLHLHSSAKFTKGDAFVGFQKDTPASVIFQATHLLRSASAAVRAGTGVMKKHTMDVLKWSQLNVDNGCTEEQEAWKMAVS